MPGKDNNEESPASDDIIIEIEGPIFPTSGDEYYSPDLDGPFFPPPDPPIPRLPE